MGMDHCGQPFDWLSSEEVDLTSARDPKCLPAYPVPGSTKITTIV
jgi:hypothetical protein